MRHPQEGEQAAIHCKLQAGYQKWGESPRLYCMRQIDQPPSVYADYGQHGDPPPEARLAYHKGSTLIM